MKRSCGVAFLAILVFLLANPVEAAAQQTKTFSWPVLDSGNCHMTKAVITIRSDGTGHFDGTTYTDFTHSGDVWHTGIVFQDAQGRNLFDTGNFDSPRMDDGNPPPRYNWGKDFNWDPNSINQIFGSIAGASINYSC